MFWQIAFITCLFFSSLATICNASEQLIAIPPYKVGLPVSSRQELSISFDRLKNITSISPRDCQSLVQLAEVESDLGDLDQAIKHGRSAALSCPEDWRTHATLAKCFLLDRNPLACRLQVERALELTNAPKDKNTVLALLLPALVELKDLGRADKVSKNALNKSPKDAFVSFCRGWVLANLKTADLEAITAYQAALRLAPNLNESHYNLGLLLARSNPRAAILELKSYLQGSPDSNTGKLAEELISKLTHQD